MKWEFICDWAGFTMEREMLGGGGRTSGLEFERRTEGGAVGGGADPRCALALA